MYSKFAPDDHGIRFSARWRSEGIVSRATGGVIWTILILVQNDREKKNKKQKTKNKKQKTKKNIADGPCTCGARASPTVAGP